MLESTVEVINWKFWLPVLIACLSLFLSYLQYKKNSSRSLLMNWENQLERATSELEKCEENLRQCGREKDELRREKYALMEHIARISLKQDIKADS